jgi:hypothetical protein
VNPKLDDDAIVFRKGTSIIEYDGEMLNDEELIERYGQYTAPYAVESKDDSYVDCACERGVGSNANTYPNHNNARFIVNRAKNQVKIVATKNIRNDTEIFLSYGRSFKMDEPTEHETVYRKLPRKVPRKKKPVIEDSDSDSD